jgi:hypothetical protein
MWPSGAEPATKAAAIVVPAPGLFSTSTGCFHSSLVFSATILAAASADPPGGNGTMIFTGRAGKACTELVEGVCAIAPDAAAIATNPEMSVVHVRRRI